MENNLSALEKWYNESALVATHNYRFPPEQFDKWRRSAPFFRGDKELRQKTRLVAALCFKDNLILVDEASLRQNGSDNPRQAIVHCLSHWIKGKTGAHGNEWAEAYDWLCKQLDLEANTMDIYTDQDLLHDCDDQVQQILEDLVKHQADKNKIETTVLG